MNLFFYGILIGWGASIPFGPINIEMMRRNLHYGTKAGFSLGLGACLADILYLLLFGLGAFSIMQYPEVLQTLGIGGSLILAWFGIQALRSKKTPETSHQKPRSFFRDLFSGTLMTLFNPYTVLFWSSLIAQVASLSQAPNGLLWAGLGVLCGTLSWVFGFNLTLHYTRHKLPQKVTHSLNFVGGIILLVFSVIGIWHALSH
ncbi:MAG: LysE family translocator [Candidatus Melainabacteria bacterium]|nr:LysE family translocator [Candidatus Melainabacteria bacterium]